MEKQWNEIRNYEYVEFENSDVMYDFVQAYNMDMSLPKDYGTGNLVYMTEAHILQYIAHHPGTTVTDISNHWKRNKATVSIQITKLEQKGFLYKEKDADNSRVAHLYLTDSGEEINRAHEAFDQKETEYAIARLREKYSDEEILAFFNILGDMSKLLQERMVDAWKK